MIIVITIVIPIIVTVPVLYHSLTYYVVCYDITSYHAPRTMARCDAPRLHRGPSQESAWGRQQPAWRAKLCYCKLSYGNVS